MTLTPQPQKPDYVRLLTELFIWTTLAALLCSLTGCSREAWRAPLVLPDSTGGTVVIAKNYYGGSYKDRSDRRAADGGSYVAKANAPVATGGGPAQDFTRAGQHGGALATAPDATAGATTRTGVPAWALVAGGVVVLLLLLAFLAYRFRTKLFG